MENVDLPMKNHGFSHEEHVFNGMVCRSNLTLQEAIYSFYSDVILGVFLSIFPYTNTGIEQAQI
jgi:hypothetical protein